MTLTETVRAQTRQAVAELLAAARMRAGDIFIIGCSSSEVVGQRIGRGSSMEAGKAPRPCLRKADSIWPRSAVST